MRIMRCGPCFVPILSVLTTCLFGCPPPPVDGNGASDLPFLDVDGNFTFDNATALPLDAADQLTFSGEITGEGDIDIYELGALKSGDRLLVDVQRLSGDLDAVAAVFDDRELLHIFNDDREPDASNLNPLINEIIRGPAGDYFLGISALAGSLTTGGYSVTVRITRDVGLPAPQRHVHKSDFFAFLLSCFVEPCPVDCQSDVRHRLPAGSVTHLRIPGEISHQNDPIITGHKSTPSSLGDFLVTALEDAGSRI